MNRTILSINVMNAAATWLLALSLAAAGRADDLATLEQRALERAVGRVAPSVVRIETIGGVERMGETLLSTGPTTGLVVDADGYILTSAMGLVGRPDSILVRLPDGRRKAARRVAEDASRQIVLLKVDVDRPLRVPEMVRRDQMRVGQWAIAVGRTFESDQPNLSVGILSATNRVWGKAIQTDAATSPNNYGGPLVDIHGRVLGLVVPLAPDSNEPIAGTQWYDSGIGFAVPAEDFLGVLPRLKRGEDLKPGLAGFSLAPGDPNITPPVLLACRPGSPAAAAGLLAGDRIVEVDGRPITRTVQLREAIGRRYAGQSMTLRVKRQGRQLAYELKLVAELAPYERPFLGILPARAGRNKANQAESGVLVRHVLVGSPAAAAGIERTDRITRFDGEPIKNAGALRRRIIGYAPGQSVPVELRRGKSTQAIRVTLGRQPEEPPREDLPSDDSLGKSPATTTVGKIAVRVPDVENRAWAYVPSGTGTETSRGVLVWLAAPGETDKDAILEPWRALCDRDGLILLVPRPTDPARWLAVEEMAVLKLLDDLAGRYALDGNRIVIGGQEGGATMALRIALIHRDRFRGAAVSSGALLGEPPPTDPAGPLAFYVAASDQPRDAARARRMVERLRAAKYPVAVRVLGELPRPFTPKELAELARWINALDRI